MQQRTGNITLMQYRCPGHPDQLNGDVRDNPHEITLSWRGTVGKEGIVAICEEHETYCMPTGKIAYVPTSEVSQVRQRWATE